MKEVKLNQPGMGRTLVAGIVGGLALLIGLFFTFALFGGSKAGQTGLLFNPKTQSHKLIVVWKELKPLPLLIERPTPMFIGYLLFAICYAFVYRSVSKAWSFGKAGRILRLAGLLWLSAAFFEMQGPFNLFHEPALPLCIALGFWAITALIQSVAIVLIIEVPFYRKNRGFNRQQ